MSLDPPSYIPISSIRSVPREYVWDEWDPYRLFGVPEDAAAQKLRAISDRALVAYTIGCAEWVVYRFEELEQDPMPYQYLEAFWAFEMSDRIALPPETNYEEWQGMVRQPIDLTLMTVLNTIIQTEYEGAAYETVLIEKVAAHLLGDATPLLQWQSAVLPRLEAFFPRNNNDPWGMPVPREALDPSFELTLEIVPVLVDQYLKNVDYDSTTLIRFFK